MISRITIVFKPQPAVNDRVDSFDGEESTILTFEYKMDGPDLMFTVWVTFSMKFEQPLSKIDILKYPITYRIEIDTGGIIADSLFPPCQVAISTLVESLRWPEPWRKIPRNRIVCPPMEELRPDLQAVVDWYNSKLN
jgi:hypothetical protein